MRNVVLPWFLKAFTRPECMLSVPTYVSPSWRQLKLAGYSQLQLHPCSCIYIYDARPRRIPNNH